MFCHVSLVRFHLLDQSLRASLLFIAAGFFCRAITTAGHDIENLVTALGDQGLGASLLMRSPRSPSNALSNNYHCVVHAYSMQFRHQRLPHSRTWRMCPSLRSNAAPPLCAIHAKPLRCTCTS